MAHATKLFEHIRDSGCFALLLIFQKRPQEGGYYAIQADGVPASGVEFQTPTGEMHKEQGPPSKLLQQHFLIFMGHNEVR